MTFSMWMTMGAKGSALPLGTITQKLQLSIHFLVGPQAAIPNSLALESVGNDEII